MQPMAEQLDLPSSYGSPSTMLHWEAVDRLLAIAPRYWLATTRPDTRPHSVPVDGIWSDGAMFFGGDPATVHVRNLHGNPHAVIHVESGESPVIVEGTVDWHEAGEAQAKALAQAARKKYGYGATPATY